MAHPLRRPLPYVVACVVLLAVLGVVVRGTNAVTRFDADVVQRIAEHRSAGLVDLARAVTYLGNGLVLGAILLVAAVLLVATRTLRPLAAATPVASLAVGAALAPLVKDVVQRPRPPLALHEVVERSSGFPSGHSAQSAAGWLALGLVLAYAGGEGRADGSAPDPTPSADVKETEGVAETTPVGRSDLPVRRRTWPIVAGAVLAGLVGISRVVLSVHSPTDVLAGWTLGATCAIVAVGLLLRRPGAAHDALAPRRTGRG